MIVKSTMTSWNTSLFEGGLILAFNTTMFPLRRYIILLETHFRSKVNKSLVIKVDWSPEWNLVSPLKFLPCQLELCKLAKHICYTFEQQSFTQRRPSVRAAAPAEVAWYQRLGSAHLLAGGLDNDGAHRHWQHRDDVALYSFPHGWFRFCR